MKIKNGFVLRKVGDVNVVVAVGDLADKFNGIITLNETGKFFWEQLEKGLDADGICDEVLKEYDAPRDVVLSDVNAFIEKLKAADIIDG